MANQEHVKIIKQGVKPWNRWRNENPEIQTDLSEADLRGETLGSANLSNTLLEGVKLARASLRKVDLRGANLNNAKLRWAELTQANLTEAELSFADLRETNLNNSRFDKADLSEANLSKATLHDAILNEANLSGANLSHADLRNSKLDYANLMGAHFANATLLGAKFSHTNLNEAELSKAKLNGADLSYAELKGANLSGAILYEADLRNATFTGANLAGADFTRALADEHQFAPNQLSNKQREQLQFSIEMTVKEPASEQTDEKQAKKFGDDVFGQGVYGGKGRQEGGQRIEGEDEDWLEQEVVKLEERDNLKFALETKSIMKVAIQLAVKEGENDWKLTTREILIAIAYYGKRKEKEYKTAQFVLEKLRSNRSDYLKDYFNRIDRKTSIDKKNREKVLKRTGYVGDTLREAKSIAIRTTDKNLIQIRHLLASLLFFRAAGKETPGAHNVVKEAGIEFPTFIREFQQYVKNTFKEDSTEAWENIFGENVAFEEQSVKENVKVEGSATVEVIDRIKIREMSVAEHGLGDRIADKDNLGFRPYVEVVARFLTHKETELPLTLSVEGEWGSGKSSFMSQLKDEIRRIYKDKGREKALIVEFDPWRHDKDEALWAAFALTFLEQVRGGLFELRRWVGDMRLFFMRYRWKDGWIDMVRFLTFWLAFIVLCGLLGILTIRR